VAAEIFFGVVKETGQQTSTSYEWQEILLEEPSPKTLIIIIIKDGLNLRFM
jgi:hypothetical protein